MNKRHLYYRAYQFFARWERFFFEKWIARVREDNQR